MATELFSRLKTTVNKSLAPVGITIKRIDDHDWSDVANFIPFKQTMEAAHKAGMSVGDYADSVMNGVPGSSQSTIDKMASLGVFAESDARDCRDRPGHGTLSREDAEGSKALALRDLRDL